MIPTVIPLSLEDRRRAQPRMQSHEARSYCSRSALLSCRALRQRTSKTGLGSRKWEGEERHPEGSYYIEWREGAKRIRVSVGKDAADANARRLRKEAELNAVNNGVTIAAEGSLATHRLIASAVQEYLEEMKISRSAATHSAYELALRNFTESCPKSYLEDVNRSDLLQYIKHLRDRDLSDRTCHNRFEHLLTFLKAFGIEKLAKKRDWPKYVTQEPESYDDDDLGKFFDACDPQEKVFFEFYLMTGFRKKEVTYCTWPDVDLRAGVVRVTAKLDHGFKPKDWEEREVPIPDRLVKSLKKWAAQRRGSAFVFPTRNGTPRKHRTQLLELCKHVAERAGLDPNAFWLHKFRATFATKHLQAGVDLRTVQLWLGHKDLESTMRYLKPARGKQIREKVNATFAGA
jgi:integrase/recombinase XerD